MKPNVRTLNFGPKSISMRNQDIADQVYFSGKDASVEKNLFGQSTYEQGKEKDI